MSSRIYAAEDDDNIREILRCTLESYGYEVEVFESAAPMLERMRQQLPDLVLMDIMMPEMDGIAATAKLREEYNIPIILLTAKSEDTDKVLGLNIGADDYITKPFSLSVLRARVNTQLRKQVSVRSSGAVQIDHFRFDFAAMCFYAGNTKVELSKTEQKLLHLLVENRGQTVPRNVLVDRIWTDGAEYVDENALSVTVKRLRDKLGAQAYIKTVYGIGYSWVRADE